MPRCVYDNTCHDPGTIFFKGRFLCTDHAAIVKVQLQKIISEIEKRENRILASDEGIGVNNPRYAVDEFRRAIRLRGQHLVITKAQLDALTSYEKITVNA